MIHLDLPGESVFASFSSVLDDLLNLQDWQMLKEVQNNSSKWRNALYQLEVYFSGKSRSCGVCVPKSATLCDLFQPKSHTMALWHTYSSYSILPYPLIGKMEKFCTSVAPSVAYYIVFYCMRQCILHRSIKRVQSWLWKDFLVSKNIIIFSVNATSSRNSKRFLHERKFV